MAGSISTRKKGTKLGMHYQKSELGGGGPGSQRAYKKSCRHLKPVKNIFFTFQNYSF